MISFRKLTSGVVVGWLSTLTNIAVGLYMLPFLIHHLGETGYGVWVLVQSTVSYMYLLDLGLRTTVVRFSAEAHARNDHAEVSNVVSAALWVRIWTALGLMAVAGVVSILLPHLFRVPAEYRVAAQLALLVAGTTISSTLVFSVFGAVLPSLGRYDLLGMLDLIRAILIAFGLVPIILHGHGIVAMAMWQLTVILSINLVTVYLCFRTYPQLRCRFRSPEPAMLRSLWNLSIYVLILNGGGQLILYTDNVVVGAFVAAAAVGYYGVAGKMVEYVRQIAIAILVYVMPLASSFRARNQFERLKRLHVHGTQAVLLVTYPVVITLLLRGSTLLRLWIGPGFSNEATRILQVLIIAASLMLANCSVNGIALALDRQKLLSLVTLGEGAANLIISIILVRRIGVLGVAIGTLIPTFVTSLLFWPRYLCRLLQMSTAEFVLKGWFAPIAALVPFAIATWWAQIHWFPANRVGFVLQTLALLPLVILGALLVFRKDVPTAWRLLTQGRTAAVAASS